MLRLPSLAFLALFAFAGCAAVQEGSHVVKYSKGNPPQTTEAAMTATYALYSANDLAPQTTVPLEKGDKIGFERKNDTGVLVAVAGNREPIQIDDSQSYYWKRL